MTEIVPWILLFVGVVLGLIGLIVLLLSPENRIEVLPATALVYRNIWTGGTRCSLPGVVILKPAVHKVLEELSLRNEAENPSNVNLITGDGIELDVDYIVRRLQVGYPGMPLKLDDPRMDIGRLKVCCIKAATRIDYKDRRDLCLTRMVARLQKELEHRSLNDLFPEVNLETGERGKVSNKMMEEIETGTNENLVKDEITEDWGFWAEVDLEDYNLPAVLRKAREERSSAQIAGQALKEEAAAAGIPVETFGLIKALSNAFGNKNSGKNKEE